MPHATPTPRPLGATFGVQPNFLAAVSSTRSMRRSVRLLRRNSTGSTPALAAMMSIWDSRANAFVFAPGARHGPMANGWGLGPPPLQPPDDRVRWFGML